MNPLCGARLSWRPFAVGVCLGCAFDSLLDTILISFPSNSAMTISPTHNTRIVSSRESGKHIIHTKLYLPCIIYHLYWPFLTFSNQRYHSQQMLNYHKLLFWGASLVWLTKLKCKKNANIKPRHFSVSWHLSRMEHQQNYVTCYTVTYTQYLYTMTSISMKYNSNAAHGITLHFRTNTWMQY